MISLNTRRNGKDTVLIKNIKVTLSAFGVFLLSLGILLAVCNHDVSNPPKAPPIKKHADIAHKSERKKADALSKGHEDYIIIPLDEYKITVYTPFCDEGKWGYATASGVKSKHLKTCAVDPEIIPLGSKILVGGLELVAVDTGSAVKGKVIDIFYDGEIVEAYAWIDDFNGVS